MILSSKVLIPFFSGLLILFAFIFNSAAAQERHHLNLESSIARALDANNQFRASYFAYKKAAWDQKNAWTQLLPVLAINSRFAHIDDRTFAERDFRRFLPPELAEQIPQTVFQESYFTSLDVTMPIFNGAVLNGLLIARANKSMAKALKDSKRQNIIFLVISGYLNIIKNEAILELQKEYEKLSRLNYEKAERLFNAGRYSQAEVLRWKVDLQTQRGIVVNSESALRSIRMDFKRLLNLGMLEKISLDGKIPERILAESKMLIEMSDDKLLGLVELSEQALIKANAALQAAKKDTRISKLLYRNTLAAYLPNVSLSYSHGWRENNTIKLDDYSPKTLLVNFSMPLFTSFKNFTSAKSEHYGYLQRKELFEDKIQNTRYLLTQNINRMINLKMQREISATNIEFNERNYRVVESQRSKGLISNIEFVDAKLNLQNAKLEQINYQYDFISGMVELYYVLGKIDNLLELAQ